MQPCGASHIRNENRRQIFRLLCSRNATSKIELSRLSGISAPTVMKIIDFLAGQGLLTFLGAGPGEHGRRPQLFCLNEKRYAALGVLVEGDWVKAGLIDLRGQLTAMKKEARTQSLPPVLCEQVPAIVNSLLVENGVLRENLLGLGLGISGIVDPKKQTVSTAPLIGVPDTMDLTPFLTELSRKYQCPVYLENDLNMAVQGEYKALGLHPGQDLVYLSVGQGIGCGVMLDGHLRRGSRNLCGEVGYFTYDPDYRPTPQAPGWLESRLSPEALRVRYPAPADRPALIDWAAGQLALCVHNLLVCYDCDRLALGGELFEWLGEPLFQAVVSRLPVISRNQCTVQRSCTAEPGLLGAGDCVLRPEIDRLLSETKELA